MIPIEDARPLREDGIFFLEKRKRGKPYTNVVIVSRNNFIANRDPTTPRTADDIMCVMGEVTLIESKLAMLIKKPMTP